MQKLKTKLLTALLLTTMVIAIVPMVNASTGFILMNTTTAPSGQIFVAAGAANLTLYFGGVTWSGGEFYLLLSRDGFSQVSTGDMIYTPTFSVASLQNTADITNVTNAPGFPGTWQVGSNWVNGSIPQEIAGGQYFVKAFDGLVTSLAVTDRSFTVIASFSVTPASGGAGTPLLLQGFAFPPQALVNLTYFNPLTATFNTVQNLTATNDLGQFNVSIPAPDLMGEQTTGDNVQIVDTIEFQATENATGTVYRDTYAESRRGLLQVGTVLATTGIFGNNTDLSASVSIGVTKSLRIAGNWFYPGNLTFLWDGTNPVGSVITNNTGFFNTTFATPLTGVGTHSVVLRDANNVIFTVMVTVIPSIILNPSSGAIGTVVEVTGYGFPAPTTTDSFNVTIYWDAIGAANRRPTTPSNPIIDATGSFLLTFVVPISTGGAHTVIAVANNTAATQATATFSIVSAFTVTPSVFNASANVAVTAKGTGFDPLKTFFVAIDNQFSPFSNTTNGIAPTAQGNITFVFIGTGFVPGEHVVALYEAGGNNMPIANATFTVLNSADPLISAITSLNTSLITTMAQLNASVITAINSGVATIQSVANGIPGIIQTSLSGIGASISSIQGSIATIDSDIGTLTTSVSNLNARVTEVQDGIATINTALGEISGTLMSIDGNVATVETSVGTIQAEISDDVAKTTDVSGISTAVWIAVIFAIIAAIAAIASIIMMRRKIAG